MTQRRTRRPLCDHTPFSLIVKRRKLERDVQRQGMAAIKFELSRTMAEVIRREKRQAASTADVDPRTPPLTAFTRIAAYCETHNFSVRETHNCQSAKRPESCGLVQQELDTNVQEAVTRAKNSRILHALADSALMRQVVRLEQKQELAQRAVDWLLAELFRVDAECSRRGLGSRLSSSCSPVAPAGEEAVDEEAVVEEAEEAAEAAEAIEVEAKQTQQQTEQPPPRERNDQSGRDFFSAPPCSSFRDAALRLLCSQYTEGEQGWTTTRGSFQQLGLDGCDLREIENLSPCFESHVGIALPDNPPTGRPSAQTVAGAEHSEVHRFVISRSVASHLNRALKQDAAELFDAGVGIRRSNVGGFHSTEEVFDGAGSSSAWYGRLHVSAPTRFQPAAPRCLDRLCALASG